MLSLLSSLAWTPGSPDRVHSIRRCPLVDDDDIYFLARQTIYRI